MPETLLLPVSAREVRRFTPASYGEDPTAPVYKIATPDEYSRARFNRDCIRIRARAVSRAELHDLLEEAAVALYDGEERADVLRLLEQTTALNAEAEEAAKDGRALPAGKVEEIATVERRYLALQRAARRDYQPFAEAWADFEYYWEVAPLLAAQHFLRGWENVTADFRRKDGIVPPEVLEQIPRADWWAIGIEAIAATRLTDAHRKN